jgi:hypothetical protein
MNREVGGFKQYSLHYFHKQKPLQQLSEDNQLNAAESFLTS